jgi:hypothetical protein
MNAIKEQPSLNLKFVLITFVAVAVTFIVHEIAHWTTGEALGNAMAMTLNSSYTLSDKWLKEWHGLAITAAGPIATLLQALAVYLLLKRKANVLLFPFLLTCLWMRLLASIINFFNLNDEGKVGVALGIGGYVLPALMVAFLLYLVYDISKTRQLSVKWVSITAALVMTFSTILIFADQALQLRIL